MSFVVIQPAPETPAPSVNAIWEWNRTDVSELETFGNADVTVTYLSSGTGEKRPAFKLATTSAVTSCCVLIDSSLFTLPIRYTIRMVLDKVSMGSTSNVGPVVFSDGDLTDPVALAFGARSASDTGGITYFRGVDTRYDASGFVPTPRNTLNAGPRLLEYNITVYPGSPTSVAVEYDGPANLATSSMNGGVSYGQAALNPNAYGNVLDYAVYDDIVPVSAGVYFFPKGASDYVEIGSLAILKHPLDR